MIVPLLAAAIALAAPSHGAARTPAGVDPRGSGQVAHFDPRQDHSGAGAVDCRVFVFAGIAGACNTDAQGTRERCCAALGTAEDARCFCDEGVVRAVRDVIGERGLEFFREFARARCGRALSEGVACGNDASPSLGEREVNALQQQNDYEDNQQPGAFPQQQQPGAFPPFPPAPGFPRAPNSPPRVGPGAPQFPPAPASDDDAFIVDLPPLPSFPEIPNAPATPLAPQTPPPPAPKPPPPVGTPGAAPQLSIPPPAPQTLAAYVGAPPSPSDPVRRKPPGLPTVWDKLNDDVADFQFGFFADAIVAVGLKGLFQSAGPFTVFAPTNRAWYSALVSLGVTKEDVFEDPSLTEVIMHHVHRGEVFSESMFFGRKIPTLHLSAPNVARSVRAALESGADPVAVRAMMTEGLEIETFQTMFRKMYYVDGCDLRRHSMDLVASNGVIHAVDCVLFPPSPQPLPSGRTVAQVIVERFELSIFEQALTGGGLLRAVNQASAENPLTVFAPTNTAFVKFMASSPSFFIDTEAERVVNPGYPGLQETLLYHFVPARLTSGQLSTHNARTLRTFEGKELFVESFGWSGRRHTNYVNHVLGQKLYVNGCRLRQVDFVCVDGVVHTIDCVLQPNFRDDEDKWFGDTE